MNKEESMKKVLFIFLSALFILSEVTAVYITRVKIYPDSLFSKAVKFQKNNDFEKAEKYYRKADKAGNIYAKCAMFYMVYKNISDDKKIEAYKTEYKTGKPCKALDIEGIWSD